MNASSTDDWTNDAGANGTLHSPKKKLHIKVTADNNIDELNEAVKTVRKTLKHAKDISARNLDECYPATASTADTSEYSSDYEEMVAIEEEPTDYTPYVSDNEDDDEIEEEIVEVEYVEELVDEDSDTESSEEFEALPPPIAIPEALKVKDSDDESSEASSETSSTEEEEEEEKPVARVVEKAKVEPKKKEEEALEKEEEDTFDDACPRPSPPRKALDDDVGARPGTIRGYSYNPELENPNVPTKKFTRPKKTEEIKEKPVLPKRAPISPKKQEPVPGADSKNKTTETAAAASPETKSPDSAKKWKRPTAPRVIGAPKRAPSLRNLDADCRPDISWTKPDWAATGPKLRSTGKSAAGNLAKPITSLPHMKKNYYGDDDNNNNKTNGNEKAAKPAPVRPSAPRKAASKILCAAPRPADPAEQTEKPQYPKSPGKPIRPAQQAEKPQYPKSHGKAIKPAQQTEKLSYPKSPGKAIKPSVPGAAMPTLGDKDNGNGDSEHKPIEWEKPDWAKKRVLRATSKTDVLYSGKDIARPIGGIRPVEEDK